MSKKIIEFSAKLNTGDFEKAFTNLKSRIENISGSYATSRASNQLRERLQGMGLIPATAQDQNKMNQQENLRKRALAEVEREAQKQYRSAERLERLEEKKKTRLQEMRRMQNVAFEDEIEHKKKILKLEQDIGRIQELRNSRIMGAGAAADQAQAMRAPGWFTGGNKTWSPGFGIPAVGGMVGAMAGPVLGALAAGGLAANTYAGVRRYYANEPFQIAQAQGAAAQGMDQFSGLNCIFSGQNSQFAFGQRERSIGINAANEYAKSMNMSSAIERGKRSASIGAMIGSAVPIPGSGLLGAGAGYLSEVIPGIKNSANKWLAIQSAFGSEEAAGKLDQLELARTFERAQEREASERAKDPLRWKTREFHDQTWRQNYDLQRRLGINDAGLFGERVFDPGTGVTTVEGGILNNALNAGVTREEFFNSISGVLSAGGSTRAARGFGTLGGQASRAGMDNANQNFARLSSLMGDFSSTEAAFKRLLGEGVRVGLDGSEFRQENNKFQEILTGAVLSTGLMGQDSVGRTAGMLGGFVSSNTMVGLQGAQNAYNLFESLSKGEEGVNAQIRGATIMDKYGYADMGSKMFLQNIGVSGITEDSPEMAYLYDQAKKSGYEGSFSDYVSQAREDIGSSTIVSSKTQGILNEVGSNYRAAIESGMSPEEARKSMISDFGKAQVAIGADVGTSKFYGNMSSADRTAFTDFQLRGDVTGAEKLKEKYTKRADEMLTEGTPSLGQSELEGVARSQKLVNEQLVTMKDSLDAAAESAKKLTKETLELSIRFNNLQNNNATGQRINIPTAGKSE